MPSARAPRPTGGPRPRAEGAAPSRAAVVDVDRDAPVAGREPLDAGSTSGRADRAQRLGPQPGERSEPGARAGGQHDPCQTVSHAHQPVDNPSLPQTLQIAMFLLYINAVFSLLGLRGSDRPRSAWSRCRQRARRARHRQRAKWGYGSGSACRRSPWCRSCSSLARRPRRIFDVTCCSRHLPGRPVRAAVHPQSREYQRIWFQLTEPVDPADRGMTHDHPRHRRAEGPGRPAPRLLRLPRGHPGAGEPLRRRHRRPPVDPRRPGAGRRRARSAAPSPTATSPCRSARSSRRRSCGSRASHGRELRLREGPLPVAGAGRLQGAVGAELATVDDIAGGVQVTMTFTFEVEGAPKPAASPRSSSATTSEAASDRHRPGGPRAAVHGRARPRRLTSTPSEKARSPEDSTSSLVSADTSTCPACASDAMRDAAMTLRPNTSPSRCTTSPVCSPARSGIGPLGPGGVA